MKLKLSVIAILSVFVMLVASVVRAEEVKFRDILDKVPAVNQNLIYSVSDSEFAYATTIDVASFTASKFTANASVGYSPKNEALVAITAKLIEIKNYLNYPILKWLVIEPGLYCGFKRIALGAGNAKDNNEWDWGAIVRLVEVKF